MESTVITLALGAAFFWASAQVIGKIALRDLNATTFNAIRFSTVALVLTPLMFVGGLGPIGMETAVLAILSGVLGFLVGNQVYFHCLKKAPAHRVIPIGNSTPVWTVLLAPLLIGEQITAVLPFSVALVVAGAFLLIPKREDRNYWKLAAPLALGAAVIFGLNEVMRKSAINIGANFLVFLWISVVTVAVALNLMVCLTGAWKGQRFNRTSVGLSVASGISAHLVGNACYLFALGMAKVTALAPFTSALIPFGFIMSILIIRERPTRKSVAGMVVIFLGVALAAL
jgi:uncharacterized membrane protein